MAVWHDEWNTVLRDMIWPDATIRELMMLPTNISIIDFIDKYFIRAAVSNEVLTNEKVRIVYSESTKKDMLNPHVLGQQLSFDIYIKAEYAHNYGNDRLVRRCVLIADRIKRILFDARGKTSFHFYCIGEGDMLTSSTGYERYNITFSFARDA